MVKMESKMSSTLSVQSVVASAFCVLDQYASERFGWLRSTRGEGACGISTVSVFLTNTFIGEEFNPEKRHHQAYTPMGEKKPGVVYKRKYRKAEDRIQPIVMQLPEEFCIVCNITGDPLENIPALPMHPPNFTPSLQYMQKWHDKLQLNTDRFSWPEEEQLAHHLVRD
jgi:hypothetical protein